MRFVCLMLSVSLDCQFLIAPSGFSKFIDTDATEVLIATNKRTTSILPSEIKRLFQCVTSQYLHYSIGNYAEQPTSKNTYFLKRLINLSRRVKHKHFYFFLDFKSFDS